MDLIQRDLGFKDIVAVLRRRYRLLFWVAIPIVLISLALAVLIPAVYRSEAVILIERQEIPVDMVRSAVSGFADQRIQVITQRVMTSTNLNAIINEFDLYARRRKTEPHEVILEKVRDDIDIEMISAEVVDPRSGRPTQATIAFRIAFESRNPTVAQRVANQLVTLYLGENVKTRKESASESTLFLSQEVEKQGIDVSELEKKLAEFKNRNVENRPEMERTIRESMSRNEMQLTEVDRRLDEATQNLLYLEGEIGQLDPVLPERIYGQFSAIERLKVIESELAAAEASYGESHPDVIRLKKQAGGIRGEVDPAAAREVFADQVEAARKDYQLLLDKYDVAHPDVTKAEKKLEKIRAKIAGLPEVQAPGKPNNPAYIVLTARYEAAKVQISTLSHQRAVIGQKLDEHTASLMMIPDAEAEYQGLVREYESGLIKYREIKAKQMEARLSENLETERKGETFNLIEPPLLPEQAARPNRISIAVIGLLVALMSGLATIAGVHALDDKIHGRRGVLEVLTAPPLALIPEITFNLDRPARSRIVLIATSLLVVGVLALVLFHFCRETLGCHLVYSFAKIWDLNTGSKTMEKIKQALDRARREQENVTRGKSENAQQVRNAETESTKPINYSTTRVINIPHDVLRKNKIMVGEHGCAEAATAYKILRTQVDQRLAAGGWNTIAITSPTPGQGKTLTAINLSVTLALEMHRTVLLVDADMRNPSVLKRFGQETKFGLIDYLLDDMPLSDILVNPDIDKLVLLPAGRQVPNSSELLSSPKMGRLVHELKTRYPSRIIVFDLPPLLASDDTLAFAPFVETVLLVLEDGKTSKEELTHAIEVLGDMHLLGTVLNRSKESQPTYYYS